MPSRATNNNNNSNRVTQNNRQSQHVTVQLNYPGSQPQRPKKETPHHASQWPSTEVGPVDTRKPNRIQPHGQLLNYPEQVSQAGNEFERLPSYFQTPYATRANLNPLYNYRDMGTQTNKNVKSQGSQTDGRRTKIASGIKNIK